ncbi:MAG: M48 family metallopeptidase [Paramuribaculum sp.]|nr:M48 family metallopeptidase [Paramuribaculum sp.]
MKKSLIKVLVAAVCMTVATDVCAQFNLGKALKGAAKAGQALTLTDKQMAEYVKESVDWMDKNNPVLPEDNPYTIRLKKLTEGVTEADGIPLNFKVYDVVDINAFACPDGSVRVFSSLMDIMSDDELMGIIGHEIGHVMKHHSKNAFRTQLLADAAKDGLAAAGGKVAALSQSQLGNLASSLVNAKYSQKQENEADNCGYDFLVSKGKNPWGMVMAFEKFQQMEGDSNAKSNYMQKMFSSHPETKSRIEKMTKRCIKDGYTRPAAETK